MSKIDTVRKMAARHALQYPGGATAAAVLDMLADANSPIMTDPALHMEYVATFNATRRDSGRFAPTEEHTS